MNKFSRIALASFLGLGLLVNLPVGRVGAVVDNTNLAVVYRFRQKFTGAYLYTKDKGERDSIIKNLSAQWEFEGSKFSVYTLQETGTVPVYRFFNTKTGAHFQTTNEDEKNNIIDNLKDFSFEGIKFYVYESSQPNAEGIHRFYNTKKNIHLFTASESEKNNIITNLSAEWKYEGTFNFTLDLSAALTKYSNSDFLPFSFSYTGTLGTSFSVNPVTKMDLDQDGDLDYNLEIKSTLADGVSKFGFMISDMGGFGGGGSLEQYNQVEIFNITTKSGHLMNFKTWVDKSNPNKFLLIFGYKSADSMNVIAGMQTLENVPYALIKDELIIMFSSMEVDFNH